MSLPHATAVGANEPGTKRLYEFTCGAKNIVSSSRCASWPATKCSNRGSSSPNTLRPSPSAIDRWMWHEFPSRSFHFAMNVIAWPSCAAISFAPFL